MALSWQTVLCVLALALVDFIVNYAVSAASCPAGWTTSNTNKCFKLFTDKVLAPAAEPACAGEGPAGHLAATTTQAEFDTVLSLIPTDSTCDTDGTIGAFIGLNSTDPPNSGIVANWAWTSGEAYDPVTFNKWGTGGKFGNEPDNNYPYGLLTPLDNIFSPDGPGWVSWDEDGAFCRVCQIVPAAEEEDSSQRTSGSTSSSSSV